MSATESNMSANPDAPLLPNSYWLLPGVIAGGEYPGGLDDAETGQRLTALAAAGIDCFVNLTRAGEAELPAYHTHLAAGTWYFHLPIEDHGVPDSIFMSQVLTVVAGALNAGRRVYVHCRAGIGRTGTVLGCLLVERGLDGEEALKQLNRQWSQSARSRTWPRVPETPAQATFVRTWSTGTLGVPMPGAPPAVRTAQQQHGSQP